MSEQAYIEQLNKVIATQAETIDQLSRENHEMNDNYAALQESNNKNWGEVKRLDREIELLKEQVQIKSTALSDVESFRERERKEYTIRIETLLLALRISHGN